MKEPGLVESSSACTEVGLYSSRSARSTGAWPSACFTRFASVVHHELWSRHRPWDLLRIYGVSFYIFIMVFGVDMYNLHDQMVLGTP